MCIYIYIYLHKKRLACLEALRFYVGATRGHRIRDCPWDIEPPVLTGGEELKKT